MCKPTTRKEALKSGVASYFTGRPCKNGHISPRGTSNHECRECSNIRKRTSRIDPKYIKKELLYRKKYVEENKDKISEAQKIKRKGDPEYFRRKWKKHYDKHAEKYRKRSRDMAKKYPERNAANARNRYALRRYGCKDRTYAEEIKKLKLLQNNKCIYCKKNIEKDYHADHIMPLYLGGDNNIDNIQILCPTCNLRKNKKHPIDFAQERGMLL